MLLSLLLCSLTASEGPRYVQDGIDGADVECVVKFFREVLHSDVTTISIPSVCESGVTGCVTICYLVNNDSVVQVLDSPKMVIHYRRLQAVLAKPIEPKTPKGTVIRAAAPLLSYLGLLDDPKLYTACFDKLDGLGNGEWFLGQNECQVSDTPCERRGLTVSISGDLKSINMFRYRYPIQPEKVSDLLISPIDAMDRTRIWLQKISKSDSFGWTGKLACDNISQVRKIVVIPEDIVFNNPDIQLRMMKAYLCWGVPIMLSDDFCSSCAGTAFVKIDSGEVLGAN